MLQHGDVKTLLQKYERFRVSIFVDFSRNASFFTCLNAQQYWISDQNVYQPFKKLNNPFSCSINPFERVSEPLARSC